LHHTHHTTTACLKNSANWFMVGIILMSTY
jgi:hypothetical protein